MPLLLEVLPLELDEEEVLTPELEDEELELELLLEVLPPASAAPDVLLELLLVVPPLDELPLSLTHAATRPITTMALIRGKENFMPQSVSVRRVASKEYRWN
jgi:hypothetical protein